MRLPAIAAALCVALAACGNPKPVREAEVVDAWVRLPAAPGRPGAAYFTVRAGADSLTLTKVTSPRVERVELHESNMTDGMMQMTPIPSLPIAAGEDAQFVPGGRHAMLFGIDPAVKAGDKIALRFTLHPLIDVVTDAEVRAAGDTGHEGH